MSAGGASAAGTRTRWAVVCDFDGTAVTGDIGDAISVEFAGYGAWRDAEDRYRAGEMPFRTLLEHIFAPIKATREEIAAFARARAVLRPGLERFLADCRAAGRPFVFCSAGLDVYIEPVLERLPPDLRAYAGVRANRATCSPEGMRIEFHREDGGCPRCGFCKGTIVEDLRSEGYRVAVCGDGTADRCAAQRADLVFARGRLPRYCDEMGVAWTPFETFDDVLAAFPR